MEGSRVFANEVQQLLLSLSELDLGQESSLAPLLREHAAVLKAALDRCVRALRACVRACVRAWLWGNTLPF